MLIGVDTGAAGLVQVDARVGCVASGARRAAAGAGGQAKRRPNSIDLVDGYPGCSPFPRAEPPRLYASRRLSRERSPVDNKQACREAAMPTIEGVVGKDSIVHAPPMLGYGDVSVFANTLCDLHMMFRVQDTRPDPDMFLAPIEGGRGTAPRHNPGFYVDDDELRASVRVHANVAVDHLQGVIRRPSGS